MTTTAMSDLNTLPKFYSKTFLDILGPGPEAMQFLIKKPLTGGNGSTIYFPRLTARSTVVSAALQTDGTVMTPQKIQDSQVSAVIKQYGDSVALSDLTELASINGTVEEAAKTLAVQAKNVLDRLILEEAYGTSATATGAGFSVFSYNTVGAVENEGFAMSAIWVSLGTTEHRMKASTIRAAAAKLRARNVNPIDGSYYALLVHSDTAARLRADSEWQTAYQYTSPESLRSGTASPYEGVKVVVDNNITTSANGSNGATCYYSVLLGQGAMGATELGGGVSFHTKKSGETTTSDPANQLVTLAWKANFVPKRLNVSCGLVVVTADTV